MAARGGPFLMAAHVRTVNVPDADRRELQRRGPGTGGAGPGQGRAGPGGRAGPDRAAGRRRGAGPADRGDGRLRRGHGGDLASALRRARPNRPGGPAAAGQALAAARGTAGSGADPDPDRAADRPEGDALVLAAAGRRAGRGGHPDLARDHRPNLAPLRGAALARGDVQFSTDPALEANVRDVVGLYLHPPEKALVLCVDEKPQIQALERTAPTLPVRPGHPEAASFDYVRHGTTTLFAALEVATGRVTDICTERHRHQEFLTFLRKVARAYPRRQPHVVVDNLSTHKHPAVRAWLERHPRVQLHFTPTSGSWLNLVEAFFSIITRQALRRGSFPTVADLIAAIERFIDAWNDRCAPFTWTKDPDTVIAKATDPRRRKTSTASVTEH